MRSRRVPVLRLGSRGPGGDARSLRLWTQASAIVRKHPQSFASVRKRLQGVGHAGETQIAAKRRIVVTFYVWYYKSVNSHRDRGVAVVKRRIIVVTFALRVFASQKCQQDCRHFWTRLGSSRLKMCQQSRDSGGSWSRNPELSSLLDSSRLFASHRCQQSQGSGGSWSRNPELSSLLNSSRVFAFQKCQQSRGSRGSWSRNPELSSLLDSSRVFASQKCQQSQGSGGWSRNAELSSLLALRLERREERGEKRDERREERREEREERREKRGEGGEER